MRIAVIGGGVFGTMIAIRLAEFGHSVSLLERLPALMQGTSSLANRLHFGFHYPRDEETTRQCKRGFRRFKQEFAEAVLPGVSNAYFIAREGSLTSPSAFLAFCRRMHLPYRQIEPDRFEPPVQQVALGIMTDELMYDPRILRRLLSERLLRSAVAVRTDIDVTDIHRVGKSFRLYADGTRLTARLGHSVEEFRYEYAAASIVELDLPRPVSLSILDGRFMCLLPLGSGGQYLLYHVGHGVIAQHETEFLDRRWLDPETSPLAPVNKQDWFDAQLASCCEFVPALRRCRLKSFLQGSRRVLAKSDATDARPSIVTEHEAGYLSVFSGKIDHSIWVADEVANRERLAVTGEG